MAENDNNVPVVMQCGDKFFVWNEEDAMKLRNEYRICGVAIGSLPRKPWQNTVFSLPLMVMAVEVHFCLTNGFAVLKAYSTETFDTSKEQEASIQTFRLKRKQLEDEQIRIFKREKLEKSKLYYGRKKMKKDKKQWMKMRGEDEEPEEKNQEDSSVNVAETNNMETISEGDRRYYDHSIRVHIPTSSAEQLLVTCKFNYPKTSKDSLFFSVYNDLWMKGYYITSAEKFGGDFLVYSGDPLRYHSKFIVIIMDSKDELTPQQLVVHGRLGSAVKKTVVLASVDEKCESVFYTSLSWKNY